MLAGMSHIRAEGVVLHAFPFKDYDQIITIFTKEMGLVKLFVKGGRSRRKSLHASLEPLTCAEFVFRIGKGDLYSCKEITPIDLHLPLRQSLTALQQGCALLMAVQRSQMPGKASPMLYALLRKYLNRMSFMRQPEVLVSSFLLKLLRHEGLMHLTHQCATCSRDLRERAVIGGESFCKEHAPISSWLISDKEAEIVHRLFESRSMQELEQLTLGEEMHRQIGLLFENLMHR